DRAIAPRDRRRGHINPPIALRKLESLTPASLLDIDAEHAPHRPERSVPLIARCVHTRPEQHHGIVIRIENHLRLQKYLPEIPGYRVAQRSRTLLPTAVLPHRQPYVAA